MNDEADRAAEQEAAARNAALASRRPEGPPATGRCHYCGERLPLPMRWCDAECRNEWEREQ